MKPKPNPTEMKGHIEMRLRDAFFALLQKKSMKVNRASMSILHAEAVKTIKDVLEEPQRN